MSVYYAVIHKLIVQTFSSLTILPPLVVLSSNLELSANIRSTYNVVLPVVYFVVIDKAFYILFKLSDSSYHIIFFCRVNQSISLYINSPSIYLQGYYFDCLQTIIFDGSSTAFSGYDVRPLWTNRFVRDETFWEIYRRCRGQTVSIVPTDIASTAAIEYDK